MFKRKIKFNIDEVGKFSATVNNSNCKDEKADEWIWVEGYKGTDKDMKCRDYQYEIGEQFDMPEDAEIKECENGFHLCRDLKDVFRYYDRGYGHRFFKVKALVRKEDYNDYGKFITLLSTYPVDKLVAKSIIFERELTADEILFEDEYKDWTQEEKESALGMSIHHVKHHRDIKSLIDLGYSRPFAMWLVNHDKYDIASAVGSQDNLSMDMKAFLIMRG